MARGLPLPLWIVRWTTICATLPFVEGAAWTSASTLTATLSATTNPSTTDLLAPPTLLPTPNLFVMNTLRPLVFPVQPLSGSAGRIFAYQVIAVHLGPVKQLSIPTRIPDLVYPPGSSNIADYACVSMEATARTPPTAYVAMEFNSTFFNNDNRLVTVGDGTISSNEFRTFANGPLLAHHAYTIFLRGFFDSQSRRRRAILTNAELQRYGLYTSSNFAPIQSTSAAKEESVSKGNVRAIAGAIGGLTLIGGCLVLVGVYYRRTACRHRRNLVHYEHVGGSWPMRPSPPPAEPTSIAVKTNIAYGLQPGAVVSTTEAFADGDQKTRQYESLDPIAALPNAASRASADNGDIVGEEEEEPGPTEDRPYLEIIP